MWKDQAKTCINNGFNLIALRHKDKRPLQAGKWEKQLLSHTSIDNLPLCGFGMVCGIGKHPIYAFDVDSKDAKTSETFMEGFELNYGTPHIRIGQKPKFLIPFRMKQTGIKKKKTPDSQQGHLDILGDGQYFVAYNIHPVTKEEYTWSKPPHEFKAEALPLLSEKDVEYLFELFTEQTTPIIKQKTKKPVKEWNNVGNRQYTNREITAFLSCFNEEFYNGTHDEWIPIVMAVHHETRGSNKGKEIARRWSKQGSTYNEENFNYKWDTFDFEEIGDKDKKRSTFASLFYHHKNLIPNGLLCDRFTDAYNKALFSVYHKGKYVYIDSLGGWFVKKAHLWSLCAEDKTQMMGILADFLVDCRTDGKDLKEWTDEEFEEEKKKLKKRGSRAMPKSPREQFNNAFRSKGVSDFNRSKSTLALIDTGSIFHLTKEEEENYTCDTRYLGDTDGITDLETGKRLTHVPNLYITKSTRTPYVEGKPSQKFIDFISEYFIDQETMEFFARCIGMALLGNNKSQKLINLLGVGGSGKSTLIKLLQLAFGMEYISHLQFKDIMSAYEGDAGTPSPNIIRAFGSRVAVINETNEHAPINEAVIKAITGGDTIAARLLYSNNIIRKRASFTPLIVTNKPLLIRSTDDSIWRRMVIIPFPKKINEWDDNIEDTLAEYTLDAKKFFVEGALDYIARGRKIDMSNACEKATLKERGDLDIYQQWIDQWCEVGNDYYEKSAILARNCSEFAREELNYTKNWNGFSTKAVSSALLSKGFTIKPKKIDGKVSKCVFGLRMKMNFDIIEDNVINLDDKRK
ncbi:MAG: DNA primase [Candidatus Liberibacter europaeus]|nr:DNA primase [Candidatus Liberibacter europaeus]